MERKELEQMTIKALRTEGERRGLGFPSRTKKADLIDRIEADQKEVSEVKSLRKPTKAEIREKILAEVEPWEGPDSKTPAAFIQAGILSGIDPHAIWKAVTISWPDYRGAGGFG